MTEAITHAGMQVISEFNKRVEPGHVTAESSLVFEECADNRDLDGREQISPLVYYNVSRRTRHPAIYQFPDKAPPSDLIVMVSSRRLEQQESVFKKYRVIFPGP